MIFFCLYGPYFVSEIILIDKTISDMVTIKIKGQLDKKWEEWFHGMTISHLDGNTILTGYVKDEPELLSILNKIGDLNLKLISAENTED